MNVLATATSDRVWDDELRARLIALWAEGHSTSEIGRRMGFSKNAIVGKVHRMNLAARPSPIRRLQPGQAPAPRRNRIKRAPKNTLPSIEPAVIPGNAASLPPPVALTASQPAPIVRALPVERPLPRAQPCCWPIGEPRSKSFRFCDEMHRNKGPYCDIHRERAFVDRAPEPFALPA